MAQEFVTGSKFFDITNYSVIESFSTRISIPLELRFTVGGSDWVIKFFPQGNDNLVSEYISVFLKLLNAKKDVQTMYSFHLRDWTNSKWLNTLRVALIAEARQARFELARDDTSFQDRPVGVTGMVWFVEGVEEMEQLASF